MIERPKRSVTRFFIPLIDVLILLFCIFLLMPFMSQPGNAESPDAKKDSDEKEKSLTAAEMKQQLAGLRSELDLARREVKKLQDERGNPTERLSVCVLEIDPKNGRLYCYRDGVRLEVPDQRTAQDIIDEHKRRSGVSKEPFFIIMVPHVSGGFPSGRQLKEYDEWFKDVPHRITDPSGPNQP